MVSQTKYYGKLLKPELAGGNQVTIVVGRKAFVSSAAKKTTLTVPFKHAVLGFSYGWYVDTVGTSGGSKRKTSLFTSGKLTATGAIRVSRKTGAAGCSEFWYKVIGW